MRAKKGERGGRLLRGGGQNADPYDAARPAIPGVTLDAAARRYHAAQADPAVDTAAKRLARRSRVAVVKCPCGEDHPAAVARSGRD